MLDLLLDGLLGSLHTLRFDFFEEAEVAIGLVFDFTESAVVDREIQGEILDTMAELQAPRRDTWLKVFFN